MCRAVAGILAPALRQGHQRHIIVLRSLVAGKAFQLAQQRIYQRRAVGRVGGEQLPQARNAEEFALRNARFDQAIALQNHAVARRKSRFDFFVRRYSATSSHHTKRPLPVMGAAAW